jgi:hypothetical protein
MTSILRTIDIIDPPLVMTAKPTGGSDQRSVQKTWVVVRGWGLDRLVRSCNSRRENERGTQMPGNSREMITTAERRFPVRIKVAVPPCGFGQRLPLIDAWLDENCGSDGWAITPSGMRGVLSEAVSIYFADVTLASAFVARWCIGSRVETTGGVFRVREDEPALRVGARQHSIP